MKVRSTLRDFTIAAAAVCVTSVLLVSYIAPNAEADHEPANKVAAAGSTFEVVNPEQTVKVLQERVKVSSPFDLILSLSSECSILTGLRTGDAVPPAADNTDTAEAFGQLKFFVTIDGRRVPVTSTETTPRGPGTGTDGLGGDGQAEGEVVFCNREYKRTVTDSENNGTTPDGIDTQEDYIRTRTANAFNWLALDVGFNYDNANPAYAANGNNVVDIEVWATFDKDEDDAICPDGVVPIGGDSCVSAIVGRRTLIAEPTNASVHEWVENFDPSTP